MQYSHKFLWNKSAGVYTALGIGTGCTMFKLQLHLAKTAVGEIYILQRTRPPRPTAAAPSPRPAPWRPPPTWRTRPRPREWLVSMTWVVNNQYWVYKTRMVVCLKVTRLKEIFYNFKCGIWSWQKWLKSDFTDFVKMSPSSVSSAFLHFKQNIKISFKLGHFYTKLFLILSTQN